MKQYTNDKGQQVYRIENISDLALLPDSEIDAAIKNLEMVARTLRLILVAAENEEQREAIANDFPSFFDWVADGEESVTIRFPDTTTAIKVELKQSQDCTP